MCRWGRFPICPHLFRVNSPKAAKPAQSQSPQPPPSAPPNEAQAAPAKRQKSKSQTRSHLVSQVPPEPKSMRLIRRPPQTHVVNPVQPGLSHHTPPQHPRKNRRYSKNMELRDADNPPLTRAQQTELEKRLASLDQDRQDGVTWTALKAELEQRCP